MFKLEKKINIACVLICLNIYASQQNKNGGFQCLQHFQKHYISTVN